jgi:hypothetical protein
MLAVASSPALADDPQIKINTVTSTNLNSGGATTLKYTVNYKNNPTSDRFQVTISNGGMQECDGDCSPAGDIGGSSGDHQDFSATLIAPNVAAGQTKTFQVQIRVQIGGRSGQASQQITVRGDTQPQTIREVNGRVVDQDGKGIENANVGVQDSQSHTSQATTNDEGRFRIPSTDDHPLLAGNLHIGAVKAGYADVTVQFAGGAGKTIAKTLTMRLLAATASPTPSATAEASPTADDALVDPPTDEASAPAADTQNASQNSDSGSSMLYIVLGALLVAAGIGAIVLLVMRRRNSRGDEPDDPNSVGPPGGVPPGGGGRYNAPDATRVAAPVGGRMNDTMLAGRSGPSIADAPTMLQQAVPIEDEFPDPYGVPAAPGGGYAGAGGYGTASAAPYGGAQSAGYDAGPPTQYAPPTQYGPPAQEDDPYGAYSAPQSGAAGYGGAAEPRRYDEPTGMYRPEPAADAYGSDDQGYGAGGYRGGAQPGGDYGRDPGYPPAGGRGRGETSGAYQAGGGYGGGQEPQQPDQGGYGTWGAPAGGIDSGNAYGPPASGGYEPGYGGAGDYGAPAGGGSHSRSAGPDYGDQGYEPRPTYGRPDPYDGGQPPANNYGPADQGGYGGEQYDGGQPSGGYYGDQGGGRHGGQSRQQPPPPPPDSTRPGQRRPLDWLDD